MSPIIHLCLFGKGYLKLKVNEIVLSKKRSAIIHIASLERMKEIFNLKGLCGTEYVIDGILYTCAGKVNLVNSGKNITGFIVKERRDKWTIRLSNDKMITIGRVEYNDDDGYIYDENIRCNDYRITHYWPICMKFRMGCQSNWQFLLNHVALKKNKLVQQICS
jgi:hypothetical protein